MPDADHKRMLEMAAKAAGVKLAQNPFAHGGPKGAVYTEDDEFFNPLGNDGDALRLAVKTGEPFVVRTSCVTTMCGLKEDFDPFVPGDDLRATRLAITRAAAAIGEKMP